MKIEIVIDESDLEQLKDVVYSNETVKWYVPVSEDSNELIEIEVMSQEEQDQRNA